MRVAHRAARGIADWAKVSRYTRRAMGPRIVVRDLTKVFAGPGRDMHALSGISLAIDDGEVRGVNAMVFQEASLFPWLSVADNVAFGLEMRGLPRRERQARIAPFLELVGLTRFRDHYPYQLSGGMKQRASLARAFVNDPEILLMDEPFAALDAQNTLLLQEELLRIWERNRKT